MRAICEACERPQPLDWKAGDLCIHCGQAVRHELRCFWCAKWTPAGKYCRRCGAAVVDELHYGAARMLKDTGTDRFTVPKMLAELDPDQVDNFTQIYQRHAATMQRHVDHVRFLEKFLYQRHWSEELQEHLITELPWPEERLQELSPAVNRVEHSASSAITRDDKLAVAKAIDAVSPFQSTRALATIVRFLLDDWSVHRETRRLAFVGAPLGVEAVLAVTSWRALYGPCDLEEKWALVDELRRSPFTDSAAVRRVMLGDDTAEAPRDALTSSDPDIAFSAALISGDVDGLTAAALSGDPLKQYAAGSKLVKIGALGPVLEVLRGLSSDYQLKLLRDIELRRKPAPTLRVALFEIADRTSDPDVQKFACYSLCYGCPPEDWLRLAKAAKGERSVYQSILQRADLPPDALEQLGLFFVENGVFSAGQWGMDVIAKEGRMPAGFISKHWADADEPMRVEFCKFAELQLEQYADEGLHRFLVGLVFGGESVEVQLAVWTSLFRWYGRSDHSGMGPLLFKDEALTRFFGSVSTFIRIFTRFLRRSDLLNILGPSSNYDRLAKFLRYGDGDVLPALVADPRGVEDLLGAVGTMMRNTEFDFMLRLAGADFLALVGSAPTFRDGVASLLRPFLGTDLDLASKTALERIGSRG